MTISNMKTLASGGNESIRTKIIINVHIIDRVDHLTIWGTILNYDTMYDMSIQWSNFR